MEERRVVMADRCVTMIPATGRVRRPLACDRVQGGVAGAKFELNHFNLMHSNGRCTSTQTPGITFPKSRSVHSIGLCVSHQ